MSLKSIITNTLLAALLLAFLASCQKEEEERNVNLTPVCKITEPRNGDDIPWGSSLSIRVTATDDAGISRVVFRINNKPVDTVYMAPYTHVWKTTEATTGPYTISAIAYDNTGQAKQASVNVEVTADGNKPEARFTATPQAGLSPFTVEFTDQSLHNPTSWKWDFGDGQTSTLQNPTHTFYGNYSYTISLTVTNPNGTDKLVKEGFINVGGYGQPCPGAATVYYQGKTYHTTLIGSQCWMKENLNYATGNSWCYENSQLNCDKYGRLYDWQTIMNGANSSNGIPSGVQGICPDGWHIPSDREWKILEGNTDSLYNTSYAGWNTFDWRGSNAGKRLKTATGWYEDGNGTDVYSFSAKPGAWRNYSGFFYFYLEGAFFWTSTKEGTDDAIYRKLYYTRDEIERNHMPVGYGMSVRCVRD